MKHIFLVNSFGLKDRTNELKTRITIAANELDLDYVIEVNDENRSTEDILEKYKKEKNIIIAVGGDGIINRVLNGVVGTKNILGYIPAGTGNDFYRTNKEDLQNGIQKVDLVKINDSYFINIACFGIDADIGNTEDIVHSKIIPKSQRYNISLLYHFLKYKGRELEVILEDETIKDEFTTVVVCNGKYYGGGFKMAPTSSINDGLLDVYLISKTSKVALAKVLLAIKMGSHEYDKHVTKVRTPKLIINSKKELESNVDGEKITSKSFKMEAIPNGIDIYYNQELIDKVLKKIKKIKK